MSVHKTKNGKYRARYREGGRTLGRTFDLKADADAFDRQVKRDMQTRGMVLVNRGSMTLAEFHHGWWKVQNEEWGDSTRSQYRNLYTRLVHPYLGKYEMRMIEPSVLVNWKADLQRRGTPGPTLKKTMTMLSGMFSHAVLVGEIQYNPLREVKAPAEGHRQAPWPLSPAEIESVRSLLKPRDATLVSVLGYMGLRPAEALRMRWEDIHEKTVTVNDTKRNRTRPGLVFPTVARDLKEWQVMSGNREGLVFPGMDWKNWRNRVWHPAFDEVGLSGDRRPYRLRSSFVSLLLADSRYSLAEVALYAGHSLEICSKYYAGLIAEFQGRDIDAAHEIQLVRKAA